MRQMAVRESTGYGCLEHIGDLLEGYQPGKVLLVTGQASYEACGARAVIEQQLPDDSYIHFSDFGVNPKLEDGERGVRLAKDAGIDLILAIGGGSAIDMAKMIKAIYNDPETAADIVRGEKEIVDAGIPMIVVPTTAGSGSEATHFAVAYIGKKKYSLAAASLLPNAVLLDGSLLKSASPYQRAINGLDALAQAIEGCWAVGSTEENQKYSLKSIELLMNYLPDIVKGNDADSLQNVMLAANLAGKSINISKTTAPHAFSYAFTSYYDVPHGHAVWLTLPAVFGIHVLAEESDISDPRGIEYFQSIMKKLGSALGIPENTNGTSYLREFLAALDVEGDMTKLGVKDAQQRQFLANQVNLQRLANNPVTIGDKEIDLIFSLSSGS